MRKIILLLFVFLISTNECFAGSWAMPSTGPITSPFGERIPHPTGEGSRWHDGIDIGSDYGDVVQTVQGGIVTYAGWMGGYGKIVIIDHGGGLETRYGHNSELLVSKGQNVSSRDPIALCGSTGYSTGAHVHFEVRVDGKPINPAFYLDPSIPIPTTSMTQTLPDGTVEYMYSDTYDMEWDPDYYINFGDQAKKFSDDIVSLCVSGMEALQGPVRKLFITLITIDLAMSAMFNLFKDQENVFEWLIKRFLRYGFLLWIITDWKSLVPTTLLGYFATVGGVAGGADAATAGALLSDPTVMMQKGAYLVGPAFTHASTIHGYAVIGSVGDLLISLLLGTGILICFVIVGLEVMLAYLEFYIMATLSVVMFAFSGLQQTAQHGDNGWKGVVQASIKVMLYSFYSMMMNKVIEGTAQVAYDPVVYCQMLAGSLAMVVMSERLSKTVGNAFR